jgi:hypothetical protein
MQISAPSKENYDTRRKKSNFQNSSYNEEEEKENPFSLIEELIFLISFPTRFVWNEKKKKSNEGKKKRTKKMRNIQKRNETVD